ncbi:MAG: FKBP-type peptidyl-prolyl cis-trans isomerase [Chlorobi bacterium]|nr:FKBP-type peptidyl-prolyl cis-trans isomerase [Chlorobiota bacterium]
MKYPILFTLAALFLLSSCKNDIPKAKFKSYNDSLSYVIGRDIGRKFEQSKLDSINIRNVAAGIKDYLDRDTSILTEKGVKLFLADYSIRIRKKAEEEMIKDKKIKFKENYEKGLKFLEENAKNDSVKTTESGLQYKILKPGTGKSPKITDKVNVFYEGYTTDGKKFAGNYDGEPETFRVSAVIKGWQEALMMMKEGEEAIFYLPSELAYYYKEAGDIKPFSVLIYKIKLVNIIPKENKK